MSASGKSLLGLWLYRSGEQEWAVKEGSPIHKPKDFVLEESTSEAILPTNDRTSIIFTLKHQVGALARALQVFQELGINVLHIELHNEKETETADVLVDVECNSSHLDHVVRRLKREVQSVKYATVVVNDEIPPPTPLSKCSSFDFGESIWFPRKISDLDRAQNVLMYGSALDADHPGFRDPVYRKRREQFAAIANNFQHGSVIPKIQYTNEEIRTWGIVFRELHKLYLKHAVPEYMENWPQLVKYCGYREDNLPQLQDINVFLKRKTGFQLRPVAGYLSPRDFLSGLAFRVFHCTQYIRHSSDPFYTPEPDCCHELLGHMPLLANPTFAQFSQEIGLASLGASDDDISKLATLYFFTVEFGLVKQDDGSFKVYGAGLLSSVAELKHAITSNSKIKKFDPDITSMEECIITSYQNAYYYTDSFEEAKEKMRAFAETIKRPFMVRYNPYTQSVEVLSNAKKITAVMSELRGDLSIISSALRKISALDENLDVETLSNLLYQGIQLPDKSPVSESSDNSQKSQKKLNMKPTDQHSGIYRTRDSIDNLQIRISLRKFYSILKIPKYEAFLTDSDDQQQSSTDFTETVTVNWQQKVFSKTERLYYGQKENCKTDLDKRYHQMVKETNEESGLIFTYIDSDNFQAADSFGQKEVKISNLRKNVEAKTSLEDENSSEMFTSSTQKIVLSRYSTGDEFVKMFILADLEPSKILVSIYFRQDGMFMIYPDFNSLENEYLFEIDQNSKQLYGYCVENISVTSSDSLKTIQQKETLNKIQEETSELMTKLNIYKSLDFECPKFLRIVLMFEIVYARDFEHDNLHVRFNIILPTFVKLVDGCLSGTTHSSLKNNNVWNLGYCHSLVLDVVDEFLLSASRLDSITINLEVFSIDQFWEHRQLREGIGCLKIPLESNQKSQVIDVSCFRDLQGSSWFKDFIERFFLGGIHKTRNVHQQESAHFYGNNIVSTGTVRLKFQRITQMEMSKRNFLQMKSIDEIITSYHKAKARLEN